MPGVSVQLQIAGAPLYKAETGPDGRAEFPGLKAGNYDLSATKDGFLPAIKNGIDLNGSLEITLFPALTKRESVEVHETVAPLAQTASPGATLPPKEVKELPNHPATVADVLPLVPGVIRQPEGGLVISAAPEHRSALVVNSADVTDPATGQFGLTVPIDIVETLNVYQTPFLAEYGRFTAGVVSVETRRGSDKFQWELNDPFPDFRIRSYHLRGIRDSTPRLNFEGPIVEGKLYYSQGVNYEIRKTAVYELPFPDNQKKQQGFNSFSQLDWISSSRNILTATMHIVPQRLDFVNLDYFNPESTTPDASTKNYTGTVSDKLTAFGGIFDNILSYTRFDARVWGQGGQTFTISPQGNGGSYFAQQDRQASRVAWSSTFASAAVHRFGTHNFKTGLYVAGSNDNGQVLSHSISLLDALGQRFEQIDFVGGRRFNVSDTELAFFGQDHWLATPKLAFDLGIRAESQEISQTFRMGPRAGVSYTPFPHLGTVLRAGFGLFFDRLPLNVYSFHRFPAESISYFDPAGQLTSGPFLYVNGLSTVYSRSSFVRRRTVEGDFSPRSATGSFQVEQPITSHLQLRVGYLQSESAGLVILHQFSPDPLTRQGANLLNGDGQSRYRQFEATARWRLNGKRELYFSYVHSRARGDLNDFSTYLGTFAQPILRGNQFGNLPADLPNRFLTWGLLQLPYGFRIAPLVELRSGFPYAVTDVAQNWFGLPYSSRFPAFFSFDSRVSKDFKVNPKYTVRISVSAFNVTNHLNPGSVHANIADPAYGAFIGQRGRHLTADFDVLF